MPNSHPVSPQAILDFWFGDRTRPPAVIAAEKSALWWGKDAQTDREIAARFSATCDAAARGELEEWTHNPQHLLALIISLDQFPRNIHRDSPRAFACDAKALQYARQCIEPGADAQLRPIERVFAYLPFEHSEELAEQRKSLALFRALAEAAPGEDAELFAGYLDFARRHHDIIQTYGRFPHRNRILGRESTAEETAFLQRPGSSF